MHWVYYFGRFLIRIVAFPFARWEVYGNENLPGKGPLLIICNHLSLADPPIVAASIKLPCVFMAKAELFENRWTRYWVKNFGAFPVRRNTFDREALRQAEDWLKKGVSVIIFPEGGRARSRQLERGMPGAAVLVTHLDVPVLPVAITGTEHFEIHKLWMLCHRPRITVTIGKPFRPEHTGKLTKIERQKAMDRMMRKIAGLLPPEYRGVYGKDEETCY